MTSSRVSSTVASHYDACSIKREFPTAWYAFFHPEGTSGKTLQLKIAKSHFPFFAQQRDIHVLAVWLFLRSGTTDAFVVELDPLLGTAPAGTWDLPATIEADDWHTKRKGELDVTIDETIPWKLRLRKNPGTFDGIAEIDIVECCLVVEYLLQ